MKRIRTSIIFAMALLIIIASNGIVTKASQTGTYKTGLEAKKLIEWAKDIELINNRFEPSDEATIGFTVNLLYKAICLSEEIVGEKLNTKAAIKWLEAQAVLAAEFNREEEASLKADFKGLKSKKKATYHFVGLAATLAVYGECRYNNEEWQEGLTNLSLEVKQKWRLYKRSTGISKIEVLDIITKLLFPEELP